MSHATLAATFPNYNHSQYLPQAIEAILAQSRQPDQFIILDDASTDNSVEIIESYISRYPQIRLVRNERNHGVVASLSRLLGLAETDYVFFGAADDYILPGFFEKVVGLAEQHPRAGISFGQIKIMDATDQGGAHAQVRGVRRWREPLYATPEVFLRDYLEAEPTWHSLTHATIYRRQAFLDVGGFRTDLGSLADTFALRAMALKYGACYFPEPYAVWRVVPGGYAATEGRNAPVMLGIVDKLVAAMRSPEFRDLFPESYVRRWQGDLERLIFEYYLWQLRERYGASAWGLWRGRLFKRWVMLKVALSYGGDLGKYVRERISPGQDVISEDKPGS